MGRPGSGERADGPETVPDGTERDLATCLDRIATERDRDAYAVLFRQIAPKVKAYMMRSGADTALAEELAQETLARIWLKAGLYRPEKGTPESWILSVARNLRIDRLRRERVWELSEALPEGHEEKPSGEPGADEQVSERERAARVQSVLAELPEDQREVITLSFVEGMSHGEIAARLDVPLGTVKSRLRLAYERMRPALKDQA